MEPADSHALDAYSQIVIGVAERLTPRVAAVRVKQERGRGEGAGSAVVLTDDGVSTPAADRFVDIGAQPEIGGVHMTVRSVGLLIAGDERGEQRL